MTFIEAINEAEKKLSAAGVSDARRDAEVLLCRALGKDRAWLLAHMREESGNDALTVFGKAVERRQKREPLQYIAGVQEFWGLEFAVNPGVLIPRPETELIVEAVLARLPGRTAQLRIVDIGTGSGCLAVSLAKELPGALVFATDRSAAALETARANAARHTVSGSIRFFEGDLFNPLEELDIAGQIDIIVANPPYVSRKDEASLQPEVREYEPALALYAGPGGTEVHERIIGEAHRFLKSSGMLVMEMGLGQAPLLDALVRRSGRFRAPDILKDLAGIDRVIVVQKK